MNTSSKLRKSVERIERWCRFGTLSLRPMAGSDFAHSIAMYKRWLRSWDMRKNARPRARLLEDGNQARRDDVARYLPQNDTDEALHTLLDMLNPWIDQAGLPQYMDSRVLCPARAGYIYDPFARNIAMASSAFESGNVECGGALIRRAFVDMEGTLTPELRSMFTLHSLLFSLAMLNMAGLFDISKSLILHATKMVVVRARADGPVERSIEVQRRMQAELGQEGVRYAYDGRGTSHPFPQIMNRLKALVLTSDNSTMKEAVLLAWSAYYKAVRTAVGASLITQCSRKEYWHTVLDTHRCPNFDNSEGNPLVEAMHPTLHYLNRLRDYAQTGGHNDLENVTSDEILSLYSFMKLEEFEMRALERVSQTKKDSVGWNVGLELAVHYQRKGDIDNVIKHVGQIIPDSMGKGWESVLSEVLRERIGWQIT